jgi:UDP-xylose/UDP-N-acetylglucosamine transporter B4
MVQIQGKSMSVGSEASASDFTTGLAILLLAQLLAAYQGAYTEDLYAQYKAEWTENLFYSHLLSLPLFLPFAETLRHQYTRLATTAPLQLRSVAEPWLAYARREGAPTGLLYKTLETLCTLLERPPRGILFLVTNAITQLSCISGVSLLAAQSSAVTVTIVLNIRKLVSFILSTLLFGHVMNAKMVLGATLVFGSGALYGWETSWRLPRARRRLASLEAKNPAGERKHQ